MATIKVKRTNEYVNRYRDYIIYIDNNKVGTIGNGKTAEFIVEPGMHTMYAKIDWCYSPVQAINIGVSAAKTFKIGAFKNARWLFPVSFGILMLHFVVKAILHFDYVWFFILPSFFAMVYFLSFGRKRYLTLAEEPFLHAQRVGPRKALF